MGMPAARVGDMHVCPMVTPAVVPIPHVGGPILPPCSINVFTGGMPQARVGDMCVCVGPPDVIVKGSLGVFVNGRPAARIGDLTAHGGTIVVGLPTVLIGDTAVVSPIGPSAPSAPAMPGMPAAPDQSTTEASQSPNFETDKPSEGKGKSGDSKPAKSEENTPEASDKAILAEFGKDIPESKKKPTGAELTNYQNDSDFKDAIKKRHPGIEKKYNLDNVNGESYKGQIFVNKDRANKWTVTHEQIHHYSSAEFIKKFSNVKGVNLNEGVTELFTRKISKTVRSGIYEAETKLAEKVAKEVGEDVLRKAYFGSDPDAMKKVEEALAKM